MVVIAMMMAYKNTKAKVRLPDDNTNFFEWSLSARYISTIYIYNLARLRTTNVHRTNKRKQFHIKKRWSRRYLAKTKTDVDYADELALLANTPAHAEHSLHSLKEVAKGIDLNVN